jgi:hypothetical protein
MIGADMITATSFPGLRCGRNSAAGIKLPLRALGFVFSRVSLLDFCDLRGYTRAVDDPKRYTISREKQVQADGKITDAVLGEFSPRHNLKPRLALLDRHALIIAEAHNAATRSPICLPFW